ncbi:MAG TPA: hypothetical protein PLS35_17160 [Nitrospira sp.]|nr:hypothetical protein [Nitrospira sp.]
MLAQSLEAPLACDLKLDIEAVGIVAPGGQAEAVTKLHNAQERTRLAGLLQHCAPRRIPPSSQPQIPRQLARGSGVSRASSAPRASVYACLASKSALDGIDGQDETTAVIALSTTAALDAALRYELSGLEYGWETVDPFLLPYAIPSAMATQVAMACGANEGAICLFDGFYSFPHALTLSAIYLRSAVRRVVIVAAEQAVPALTQAMGCQGMDDLMEGAVAFVVRQPVDHAAAVWLRVRQHHPRGLGDHGATPVPTVGTSLDDMLSVCSLIASLPEVATSIDTPWIRSRSGAVELLAAPHG